MIKRRVSSRRVLSSFHRIMALRHVLAITVVTIGLSSCYNEPEFIGKDLIPTSDLLSVKIDTSFEVSAHTVETDSIPTGLFNKAVLGCYNSEIFGKTKADFLSSVIVNTTDTVLYKIIPRPIPQSLYLIYTLERTWGTQNKPINVKVYELSDSLSYNTYYNGMEPVEGKYYPTLISYPTTYSGDSIMKIQLTDEFANKLINVPDTALKSNIEFAKIMKGLYITSDDYTGSDGVLYLFSSAMKMELAYDSKEGGVRHDTIFKLGSGVYTSRYNHFQHDYTTARPDLKINHLNDTTFQDSLFYISGLGGYRGLIKLNGVKEWIKKMPIAINRAELRFDVQEHPDFPSDSLINPLLYYYYRDNDTSSLKLYSSTSTNDLVSLYDYSITEVQTTRYSKPKNYYSIDVTLHLQNLLKGKIKKEYFYLEPSDFKVNYKEGIFRSGSNSNRMKLIITYTKL